MDRGHSQLSAEPDFRAQIFLEEAEERTHFCDSVSLVDHHPLELLLEYL